LTLRIGGLALREKLGHAGGLACTLEGLALCAGGLAPRPEGIDPEKLGHAGGLACVLGAWLERWGLGSTP